MSPGSTQHQVLLANVLRIWVEIQEAKAEEAIEGVSALLKYCTIGHPTYLWSTESFLA